jgi:arsenate reductase
MYPELTKYIEAVLPDMKNIPEERKQRLEEITSFLEKRINAGDPANAIFICTHNSRRSHLSQLWAATAAAYYGLEDAVHTLSGGTEATAFNPRAVKAIERAGFHVVNPGGNNPHYEVTYEEGGKVLECFSKTYDQNVSDDFVAVMTCSDADKNCPIIPGASLRVSLPYIDPKESDGTEAETSVYDKRCRQIATEMFYLISQMN